MRGLKGGFGERTPVPVFSNSLRGSQPCPSFPWCFGFLGVFLAVDFLGVFGGLSAYFTGILRVRRARSGKKNSININFLVRISRGHS